MFMLRIEYESRLRLDFGFTDLERATEAKQRLTVAKDGVLVVIRDDHGHDAVVRAAGIQAIVLTTLDVETEASVIASAEIDRVRQEMMEVMAPQDFNRPVQQHNMEQPRNGGAVPGARAPFSS